MTLKGSNQFTLQKGVNMSHEISIQNGRAEVFTAGAPAWHNLGVNVSDAVNWEAAAKLAHLDWQVIKNQLEFAGNPVNAWGLFRGDNGKFLGTCGNMYEPIQYTDAFGMVDALLTEGAAHYETAGALGDGQTIWTLARIPQEIRIAGTNDITKNYLLFVDYRQQGKSAIVKMVGTRVVCNNTLSVALSEKGNFFRIPHNGNVQYKIEEAKRLVSVANKDVISLNEKFNALAKVKTTKSFIRKYLTSLFPEVKESPVQQNKCEKILELFEDNDGNKIPEVKYTAWGLFNATTQYIDHFSPVTVRNQDGTANIEYVKEFKRAENAMFGTGDEFKNEALENIMSLVTTGDVVSNNAVIDNILKKMA